MPPAAIVAGFCAEDWLGNARELRNAVEAYLALGEVPPITRRAGATSGALPGLDVDRPYHQQRQQFLAEFRRAYVSELLARTNGNVAEASRRSGIERSYLNKLAQHCVPIPASDAADSDARDERRLQLAAGADE